MWSSSRINPRDFPDSPYAEELRRDSARRLRFAPTLELQFTRARLWHMRGVIRVVCVAAVLLLLVRGAELWLLPDAPLVHIVAVWTRVLYLLVFTATLGMAGLAWSPTFDRLYLDCARAIVPLRGALVAGMIAYLASHGQMDLLVVLPALVVGPLFLLGLPFRIGLVTALAVTATFMLVSLCLQVPVRPQLRSGAFLVVAVGAAIIGAWRLEYWIRTWFLESHLIGELAERDGLTGTKNRRLFDDHLARLWQQAIRDGRQLAILLLDVDHFKVYNDRHGHQAGDAILRRVAQSVQRFVNRPLDMLARYGGEEFGVILYDVDPTQARGVAERIRCAVAGLPAEPGHANNGSAVTVSVGVAGVRPKPSRDCRGALQLADEALYDAKRRGRNRVVLMDETQHQLLITGIFAAPMVPAMSDSQPLQYVDPA